MKLPALAALLALPCLAASAGCDMGAKGGTPAPAPKGALIVGPAPPAPPGPAKVAASPAPPGDLDGGSSAAVKTEKKKPEPGSPERPLRLKFDELMQWDLDPNDVQVPKSIQGWSGKTIEVVGYMIPYGDPDHVDEFLLVNSLGSCCFGQAPRPHHIIEVKMVPEKKVRYVPGTMRTRGIFRVREHREGKYLVSVYSMTATECVEVETD